MQAQGCRFKSDWFHQVGYRFKSVLIHQSFAPMAELADAPDSKSGSFGSPGSNPGGSTKNNQLVRDKRFESSLVVHFIAGWCTSCIFGS